MKQNDLRSMKTQKFLKLDKTAGQSFQKLGEALKYCFQRCFRAICNEILSDCFSCPTVSKTV